jgi:hypothetical protein
MVFFLGGGGGELTFPPNLLIWIDFIKLEIYKVCKKCTKPLKVAVNFLFCKIEINYFYTAFLPKTNFSCKFRGKL